MSLYLFVLFLSISYTFYNKNAALVDFVCLVGLIMQRCMNFRLQSNVVEALMHAFYSAIT